MKASFIFKFVVALMICCSFSGCTEPYQMQSNTFEDALVVEATITNELKTQEIKITHTYRLEDNGPKVESGAAVHIIDNAGNQYDFIEQDGIYASTAPFQAIPGREYKLFITTQEGKEYISNTEKLTTENMIESVNTADITSDGVRGVQITVNNYDPTNTSKFYRYEYEETYKVIAPKWSDYKAYLINPLTVSYMLRGYESRTCYVTKQSDAIFLTNTSELSEDRVDNFPIRFIGYKDYIISERYSLLVKQYVVSQNAYTFYKTIKALSDSGEILSPNQPGFVSGNIKSVANAPEKVIGFFDVSSVSEKRIFFNYDDLFPHELKPAFFIECPEESLKFGDFSRNPPGEGYRLINYVQTGTKVFYDFIYNPLNEAHSLYVMVPANCGDCTTFASNVVPSFWQD